MTLSLTNEATRLTRTTVTNASGEYVFDRVDPGKYKLEATSGGFKKLERSGVVIETQQQLLLDLVMEVGAVTETVVITDDAPLIRIRQRLGRTGDHQTIPERSAQHGAQPVLARRHLAELRAPAGNPTFNRQQDQSGSSQISLAGGPVRGNNYLLDGVPIADIGNRRRDLPDLRGDPGVEDAGQQYDAEAGRTGGGVFNVTPRSGSNQFHGSLFGFLRPNSLQAITTSSTTAGALNVRTPDQGSTGARSAAGLHSEDLQRQGQDILLVGVGRLPDAELPERDLHRADRARTPGKLLTD